MRVIDSRFQDNSIIILIVVLNQDYNFTIDYFRLLRLLVFYYGRYFNLSTFTFFVRQKSNKKTSLTRKLVLVLVLPV